MNRYAKYAATAAFIVLAASLLPWRFDFPLNDDWAYALAVRTLTSAGRLALSDWGSSTQVMHILFGALFAKIFGFSFAVLRSANVLMAAAGVFMFVRLLDEFGAGEKEKLAAGLALAVCPLYLSLANSFMTDAHYFFWMSAACYFYVRRIKDPSDGAALAWAGACAAAAYLTRQLGAALPLAFTVSLWANRRLDLKELLRVWALPGAAMLGYWAWFKFVNGPTWASENYVGASTLAHLARPLAFAGDSLYRLFASMIETGLLLLPLAAGYAFSLKQFTSKNGTGRRVTAAAPWVAMAVLGGFAFFSGPLPYLENTLSRSGLGVLTLGGAALKPAGIFASQAFWTAATAAAVVSAVFLMSASGLALRGGGPELRFFFLAAFGQLAISLLGAKYFDRYLLPTLLPWFALAAVFAARGVKFSAAPAALVLALYAGLGWAGMKDYLAWNAAKWELAGRPHPGLAAGEIVNGFDYEAWQNYEKNMAYLKSMKPLSMIEEWEWQKINRYKAVIAYAPPKGLAVQDKIEYSTPLSRSKAILYLAAP